MTFMADRTIPCKRSLKKKVIAFQSLAHMTIKIYTHNSHTYIVSYIDEIIFRLNGETPKKTTSDQSYKVSFIVNYLLLRLILAIVRNAQMIGMSFSTNNLIIFVLNWPK